MNNRQILENKIDILINYFDNKGINYSKFSFSKIEKGAYPNFDEYMRIPPPYNIEKWLDTIRNIYAKEHNGVSRATAIKQSTSGWQMMEVYDFLNWVKFYEEGAHLKYKTAQLWYENGAPGYFLHVKKDAPKEEAKDIDFAKEQADELAKSEKKQIIERQRSKIIGRLDSAEKLLRSPDGQIFSGKELESLLDAIYQLKKKIHMLNKISTSTKLYEDIIIREANILNKNGFTKAADALYSLSQEGGLGQVSPGDPAGAGHPGAPGGLPSMGPGMPQNAPSESAPETGPNENSPSDILSLTQPAATTAVGPASPMPTKSEGITEFLKGMNTSKMSDFDDLEVNDNMEVDDMEVNDQLLVREAQVAPPISPKDLKPVKTPPKVTEEKLEVSEDEAANLSDFDNKVDEIFSNISIEDVVNKLEDLSKIFKTREIPRQLNLVDMMLDGLGLASFFPSLSEAANKALESNNYISTRIEDILSKLRGSMHASEIDLKGNDEVSPQISGIKDKLKQDEEKENARKKQRKEQEAAEFDAAKETPEIEIEEDLAPPPTPAAPAAPVPAPAPKAPPGV